MLINCKHANEKQTLKSETQSRKSKQTINFTPANHVVGYRQQFQLQQFHIVLTNIKYHIGKDSMMSVE